MDIDALVHYIKSQGFACYVFPGMLSIRCLFRKQELVTDWGITQESLVKLQDPQLWYDHADLLIGQMKQYVLDQVQGKAKQQ